VMGYLAGGVDAWEEAGLPIGHIEQIDVRELDRRREVPALQIVDVRMPGEWDAGIIPGAQTISLVDLPTRLRELDPDQPTAVVCSSGYRSGIASAILARHDFSDLANVLGGMTAWQAADLATVPPVAAPAPATAG